MIRTLSLTERGEKVQLHRYEEEGIALVYSFQQSLHLRRLLARLQQRSSSCRLPSDRSPGQYSDRPGVWFWICHGGRASCSGKAFSEWQLEVDDDDGNRDR